jgi:hypothetical protein
MMDIDAFQERAAIVEYDGGLSRFEAETLAAKEQRLERWEALRYVKDSKPDPA